MGNACCSDPSSNEILLDAKLCLKSDTRPPVKIMTSRETSDLEHYPHDPKINQVSRMNRLSIESKRASRRAPSFKFKSSPEASNLPIYGPLIYPNNSTYTGQYKNGIREGYGELVFQEGSVYQGNFKDD